MTILMIEEQMINCEMCGKLVPKSDLSRDKECGPVEQKIEQAI